METKEKELIKLKFAICLNKFLSKNKIESLENKSVDIISSFRKLESETGVSYPIIQLTSIGERDLQITSAIRLIEGLKIRPSQFFELYDSLTDDEILEGQEEINRRKNHLKKDK